METHEMLNKIESILDQVKTAVLATTDSEGHIHMRWMTPVVLKNRPGVIFAFSVPNAPKIKQIEKTGRASWMIQTRDLREIINARGRARIVDNPALKTELMDILGSRLVVFWKANAGQDEFVVIETIIEHAEYFKPMEEGSRKTVRFE